MFASLILPACVPWSGAAKCDVVWLLLLLPFILRGKLGFPLC